MKIEIKNRYTGAVLFETNADDLRAAVVPAVKIGADLRGADLVGAYLRGAYLVGANLRGAYLVGADLVGADLIGADLRGADLRGADLVGADLVGAYLHGADLVGAYLRGADLRGAYLGGADLVGAYLGGADLRGAKLQDATIMGENAVVQISPIGSRQDVLTVFRTDKGLRLQTGCFYGDADTFLMKVMDTHGTNQHATNYRNALELAASMLEGGK